MLESLSPDSHPSVISSPPPSRCSRKSHTTAVCWIMATSTKDGTLPPSLVDIIMEDDVGASTSAAGMEQTPDVSTVPSPRKASFASHSFGAHLQSAKVSPLNKRQQAAHRARMVALSKQLRTRLQYAVFKVEHGWSKQSLSEVENLYYKHRRASGSAPSPGPRTSPSTIRAMPSSTGNSRSMQTPSTPVPSWRTSPVAKQQHYRKQSGGAHDHPVESIGGLVTPPASGGLFPNGAQYKDLFGSRPSFASGLGGGATGAAGRRSPSLTMERGTGGSGGSTSGQAGGSGRSYADFWSKIGGTGPSAAGSATHGGSEDCAVRAGHISSGRA